MLQGSETELCQVYQYMTCSCKTTFKVHAFASLVTSGITSVDFCQLHLLKFTQQGWLLLCVSWHHEGLFGFSSFLITRAGLPATTV